MKIILILLAWATIFIAYNFICLYLSGGEMVVHEHSNVILTIEMCLSVFIAAGSLGFLIGYIGGRLWSK
jgi:hypothetical protein